MDKAVYGSLPAACGKSTDLPVLLQQGDQEVDGVHDVGTDLTLSHGHVGNGDAHAQHLLQLELDRGLGLVDLQEICKGGSHASHDLHPFVPCRRKAPDSLPEDMHMHSCPLTHQRVCWAEGGPRTSKARAECTAIALLLQFPFSRLLLAELTICHQPPVHFMPAPLDPWLDP